jgi:hypothetical protein
MTISVTGNCSIFYSIIMSVPILYFNVDWLYPESTFVADPRFESGSVNPHRNALSEKAISPIKSAILQKIPLPEPCAILVLPWDLYKGPVTGDPSFEELFSGRWGEISKRKPLQFLLVGAWTYDGVMDPVELRSLMDSFENPNTERLEEFLQQLQLEKELSGSESLNVRTQREPASPNMNQNPRDTPLARVEPPSTAPVMENLVDAPPLYDDIHITSTHLDPLEFEAQTSLAEDPDSSDVPPPYTELYQDPETVQPTPANPPPTMAIATPSSHRQTAMPSTNLEGAHAIPEPHAVAAEVSQNPNGTLPVDADNFIMELVAALQTLEFNNVDSELNAQYPVNSDPPAANNHLAEPGIPPSETQIEFPLAPQIVVPSLGEEELLLSDLDQTRESHETCLGSSRQTPQKSVYWYNDRNYICPGVNLPGAFPHD